jgi:hypothetical protein
VDQDEDEIHDRDGCCNFFSCSSSLGFDLAGRLRQGLDPIQGEDG